MKPRAGLFQVTLPDLVKALQTLAAGGDRIEVTARSHCRAFYSLLWSLHERLVLLSPEIVINQTTKMLPT